MDVKKDLAERKDNVDVEKENDIKVTEEKNDLKEVNTKDKINVLSEEIAQVETNTNNQKSSELNKIDMAECVKFEMNLDDLTLAPKETMTETAVDNEAVDKEGLQRKEMALMDIEVSVETETNVSASGDDKSIRDNTGPRGINAIGGNLCSNSEEIVRTKEVSESEALCDSGVSTSTANSQLPEDDKSTVLVAQEISVVEAGLSKSEESLEPTVEVSVQTHKKKTPPPKPQRTSSLKRDSQPLINTSVDSQEQIQEIAEEELTEKSSPQVHVGSDEDKIVSSGSTPKIPKDPPMSLPTRNVTFQDDVESKESSFSNRSKSFSSATKRRSVDSMKETTVATKSEPEGMGVTRSLSFGGVMKRIKNPPRPSPPKFFVEPSQTSDSTVAENENEEAGSNEQSG